MQRAQAKEFYESLSEREKEMLAESIAEDIYFEEKEACKEILCILHETNRELTERIKRINGFTRR